MKKVPFLIITILLSTLVFGQDKFGIGLTASPDFNFYKYSDEKYRDDERSDKTSLGFSAGLFFNFNKNDRIDIFSSIVYAEKHYSPDRLFDFGILREVNIKTIDIPVNVKYHLKETKGLFDSLYLFGGLTYQIEIDKVAQYDFFDGYDDSYDFMDPGHYLFPNIGVGVEKSLTKHSLARLQLNYRFLKCHCEYLNPWIDKLAIEVAIMKTWANKK